ISEERSVNRLVSPSRTTLRLTPDQPTRPKTARTVGRIWNGYKRLCPVATYGGARTEGALPGLKACTSERGQTILGQSGAWVSPLLRTGGVSRGNECRPPAPPRRSAWDQSTCWSWPPLSPTRSGPCSCSPCVPPRCRCCGDVSPATLESAGSY